MKKSFRYYLICFILFLINVSSVHAGSSVLNFSETNLSLKGGEQKTVKINLDPAGEKVVGVDMIIKFDPKFVKVADIENLKVFSSQSGKAIDNVAGTARYFLSNSYGVFQTEAADIAAVTFEGEKETAATSITFDFTPASTKDTNVAVMPGQDALGSVNSLVVAVQGNNTSSPVPERQIEKLTPQGIVKVTVTPTPKPIQRISKLNSSLNNEARAEEDKTGSENEATEASKPNLISQKVKTSSPVYLALAVAAVIIILLTLGFYLKKRKTA